MTEKKHLRFIVQRHQAKTLHYDLRLDAYSPYRDPEPAAENMGPLRHVALNLLKQEKTEKVGINNKRSKAALDLDYLLQIILN